MKPRFDKLSTNGKNYLDFGPSSVHPELVEACPEPSRRGWLASFSTASNTQHPTPSTQSEVEECFLKVISIAQKQQAKSLELRAVRSLARLWQRHGKHAEAHQMLSEVYNWFTEGFETKDLQEAKALLGELRDRLSTSLRH